MSDTPEDQPAVNGVHHELSFSDEVHLDDQAVQNMTSDLTSHPLIGFILNQLQPVEQMGFLRGTIIWLSARIGTVDGRQGDVDLLEAFNLAFQATLRTMKLRQDEQQQKMEADAEDTKTKVDADARSRGFENAQDMQVKLTALYGDVSARVGEWFKSTEPGGDPTSSPDTDALLYDVYRIVNGLAR